MSFFIPDKDTDKLYVQFFRPKYQQIKIFVQKWVDLCQKILKAFNKLTVPVLSGLSGRLQTILLLVLSLSISLLLLKEKTSWVIPNVVVVAYRSGCLWELFITKFKSQFKQGSPRWS